jgi:hypothetical protein
MAGLVKVVGLAFGFLVGVNAAPAASGREAEAENWPLGKKVIIEKYDRQKEKGESQ